MRRPQMILVVSLILTLAACTRSTLTPDSVPPTTIPTFTSPTLTPTSTREAPAMIVTLELWLPEQLDPYAEGPGAGVLPQQLADFSEAYPDLQVEVVVKKGHGRGGLLDFLRTARDAAPSVLPDLIVVDAADLETLAGSDLIQPLDDLLAPPTTSDRFSFATAMGQVDQQTIGSVIGADMQHLAYRPALFDSPPVSWTQVVSAPAPFLFPAGGYDQRINDATLIQYMAAGGKLTDADGRPWLDKQAMVSVFDFYSDCVTATVVSPTIALDIAHADQAWQQFQAGEGALTVVRAGRYWLEADQTIAPAAIPTQTGQPLTIARGWTLAMVADDPARQDLAMLLLNWLTAPEHNAQWTQAAGYLPGARSALRLWDISDDSRAVLRGVMEAAIPPPAPGAMAVIGPPMQEALEAVLTGRATPEEAAAAAVESLER